jgi:hypothetical protein
MRMVVLRLIAAREQADTAVAETHQMTDPLPMPGSGVWSSVLTFTHMDRFYFARNSTLFAILSKQPSLVLMTDE